MHKLIHALTWHVFTFCSCRRCDLLPLPPPARPIVLMMIAWGLTIAPCAADQVHGVDTDRCKDAIGAIMRNTDAKIVRLSPTGDNMFFAHVAAHDFVLHCAPYQRSLSVSISYNGAFPSAAYFDLVAKTGAVITGDSVEGLKAVLISCQHRALESADPTVNDESERGAIECTAFTRDGGGTLIDVRLKPAPDPDE